MKVAEPGGGEGCGAGRRCKGSEPGGGAKGRIRVRNSRKTASDPQEKPDPELKKKLIWIRLKKVSLNFFLYKINS